MRQRLYIVAFTLLINTTIIHARMTNNNEKETIAPTFSCEDSLKRLKSHLLLFMTICENLFYFICENLFELFENSFMGISSFLKFENL